MEKFYIVKCPLGELKNYVNHRARVGDIVINFTDMEYGILYIYFCDESNIGELVKHPAWISFELKDFKSIPYHF